MKPIDFEGAVSFGKPKDWDEERDGTCGVLPVKIVRGAGSLSFLSVWAPSPEERQRIANGENLVLSCVGTQVPVMLSVADIQGTEVDLSA